MSRTKPTKPLTTSQRTKAYETRQKERGVTRSGIWCKPEHANYLRDLADALVEDPKLLKKVKELIK